MRQVMTKRYEIGRLINYILVVKTQILDYLMRTKIKRRFRVKTGTPVKWL